ncbi:MAG: hypothetical protein K8H84_07855 [Sulfuricella denitrificans]|nr:hypothetical protein [Sulfuricella denitrificans]
MDPIITMAVMSAIGGMAKAPPVMPGVSSATGFLDGSNWQVNYGDNSSQDATHQGGGMETGQPGSMPSGQIQDKTLMYIGAGLLALVLVMRFAK